MNPRRYRERVAADLERWIAAGWVPTSSRELILADLPADPPGRTALWLGMIGATLAGLAIIAGIADNWAVIPRALKLVLLLALFWSALTGAISANARGKPNTVNALVLLAALIFAASVGLIGQSLNIPGDPENALLIAAIGAGVLALAGSSIAAGIVYLALVALLYWASTLFSVWGGFSPGDNLHFALFLAGGLALSLVLRSRLIAHGTLLLAGALVLNNAWRFLPVTHHDYAYVAASVWGALGALGLLGAIAARAGSGILLGWSAWHGLLAFGLAGIEAPHALTHRILWIALSIGVIALVARLRQNWTLAAGVISLVAACFIVLLDLGLELSAAALVFGGASLVVLAIAYLVRRRGAEAQ
jgi:uncharacterized membrane protein